MNNQNQHTIKVGKSNVEGGCEVLYAKLLKQSKSDIALVVFLSVITCGVFLLLLKWSFRLRRKFLYKNCSSVAESTHVLVRNEDGVVSIQKRESFQIRNQTTQQLENWVCFKNRKLVYVLRNSQEGTQEFRAVEFPICEIPFSQLSKREFLTAEQVIEHREEYGICEKTIEIPSLFGFLAHEMTSPFYFLQYASVIIWLLQNYVQFAVIIISVQFAITLLNYAMTRMSLRKIQQLAKNNQTITVFRADSQQGKVIDCKELVVGDIIELKEKMVIPCDCMLLSGELLMNEVSLTGESVPIPKSPIGQEDESCFDYSSSDHKKFYLFDGTTIFQSKTDGQGKVLAKVIRVGYTSFKGQILRSVLYPRPTEFDFIKNSILFFAGLSVVMFIIFLARVPKMVDLEIDVIIYFYRLFDTITWIVPPFLPIFQSLSLTFSLMRLRNNNIFGIEPQKTLIAGKVTHMCFDKTGTLTTIGIDVNGYYGSNLTKMLTIKDVKKEEFEDNIHFKLFSTCHGAYLLNNELVGDMLDIEMLKYSQYKIENSKDVSIKFTATKGSSKLEVLNIFEFDSDVQRMSSIVRDTKQNKCYAFLKGAPERVKELCTEDSIPANFTEQLNKLSLKGFRVLGLSYREIDQSNEDVSTMQRQDLEQNLRFLGFLVLENKLKEDTADVIKRLREGGVQCKIISGDNPLTTLQTGSECNILNPEQKIFFIDMQQPGQNIVISKVESEKIETLQIPNDQNPLDVINQLVKNQEQIVITGKIIEHFENMLKQINQNNNSSNGSMSDHRSSDKNTEQGNENQNAQQLTLNEEEIASLQSGVMKGYQSLVKQASVFSRMRPEQKRRIIELLQLQHIKVGMIGDGANDCESIKQADVGISFSSSDAALTAPFSSKSDSISCVETILCDGRATMAINVEIFRCIVIQNILKFVGCMVMLEEAQNFGDFQFTFLSFLCGMPLLALLAASKPVKKLQPEIPDDKFYKLPNCVSIYSQIIIYSVAMIISALYLKDQPWHISDETLDVVNGQRIFRKKGELNTVVFLMIVIFYMTSCFSFYISKPFKQLFIQNYLLTLFWLAEFTYAIVMFVKLDTQIPTFDFDLNLQDEQKAMNIMLMITLLAGAGACLFEDLVVKKFIAKNESTDQRLKIIQLKQ
ncbi:P-type family IC HAD ATPase (macronuclear) [Tetrahymena thermophila SB210]|uniref:Cation-transporting ATPase n=1 Tax=Tetrahymena thermophila (strain SB210) TaxID=312017 RepID=Q237J9_TETTS|nr:P-type family IC HAD ATPase [Tetrahymena thermophila SB210]EAR92742.1 P-type family IC HAD ATPase [Tetrahymena thermophila SB210]|eukprot:XP_001012987.1 P-type family IC HAD ATPase [Tetrahymena thermophila SB210]